MAKNSIYKITDEGRECGKCKTFLPWEMFSKNKHGACGHQSQCKKCWSTTHAKNHSRKGQPTKAEREDTLLREMARRETMTDAQLRQEYLERKAQWRKEWDAIDWVALKEKVAKELAEQSSGNIFK